MFNLDWFYFRKRVACHFRLISIFAYMHSDMGMSGSGTDVRGGRNIENGLSCADKRPRCVVWTKWLLRCLDFKTNQFLLVLQAHCPFFQFDFCHSILINTANNTFHWVRWVVRIVKMRNLLPEGKSIQNDVCTTTTKSEWEGEREGERVNETIFQTG